MSEIRVNTIVAAEGTSAPNLPYGIQVPTGMGITGAGGLNITGVATATSFVGNITGTVTGNATGLTGTPNISCGTIAGSTGTFSGAVNVDATTDSTSSTTGALIVDGGLGVAKNVYIGAGLSVAGTLTYEDVTSVDSVGMVTAKSGVNVSGGQLQVGVAYSVGSAGITTGLGFVCGSSGFNGEAGTSNFGALNVGNAGEFKVGTGVTISSTAGVATFAKDVTFLGAAGNITFDHSADDLVFGDGAKASFGSASDMDIWHDGSDSYITNTTGILYIQAKSGEHCLAAVADSSTYLYFNGSTRIGTTKEGAQITGFTSTTAGLGVTGGMWEGAFIKAGKLSDNKTLGISTSNIFVFTTQESTTATPNIIWDDDYALSSKMKVGDAVTVTVITTAAAGGYSANWTIDGNAVSEQWNGGSAPSGGGSDGYDIYTHTLVRKAAGTGDTGWLMFSNVSNFT